MPDLEMFTHFHFLRPGWLLMILPALILVRYFFGHRAPETKWRKVIAPHLLAHLVVTGGKGNRFKPTRVFMIQSILIALAMAGPTWQRSPSPFAEDLAPLAIVLDLSVSMDQTDIQPSRLERAKQKIHDLLQLRSGSRTGVIAYSGSSHTVIPLTDDRLVIENLLFAVRTDMMPRRGKAPARTIPLIEKMFQEITVPGTILVITDGASPEGRDAFSRYCETARHQLIVYGMGRAHRDESRTRTDEKNPFGDAFIPLATKELAALAKACQGVYQAVTPDKSDMKRISRRIDYHFTSAQDGTRPWIDAGYYFLFPVALLTALFFRRGWTLTWIVAGILLAMPGAPSQAYAADHILMDLWLTPDQQGRYYFEKGDYTTAADRFEDPLWKGVSFYMNENFETAAALFARIESREGFFNLGNALAHGRHYVHAVAAYSRVLAIKPDHAGATGNIRILQGIIDEINRVSESQVPEGNDHSKELGDAPLRAQGAEKRVFGKKDVQQYSAEQILNDPELNEIWMRQVQQDPSRFLQLKFQMQLNPENTEKEETSVR
ncbi:MAG: VWA domain-containing protein [Deltaproteobacteria bacterium]|nr:VWA domain-containing protein [Deltaproteobacteria bacterium]